MLRSFLAPLVLLPLLSLAAIAGCSDETGSSGASTTGATSSGAGSTGGEGGNTSTTSAAQSSSVGVGSTGAGGSGGGAQAFVCDPPAAKDSIYEFSAESYNIDITEPVSLCQYRGDVMFIVNTASQCGFTPQYKELQATELKYKAQGLHVLGFLSNDFGMQAGTDEEIKACNDAYKVTFEQFAIIKVKKGEGQHPLFTWLTSKPGFDSDVTWNFNKWLVGRDGTLVARWTNETVPNDPAIVAAIEAEIAKPKPQL